jgi:alkane 1-monooxygenase
MAFTGIGADGKEITYRDGKRWLWLTPFLSAGVIFFFGWLYFATGKNPIVAVFPLIYIFGFIPFLDMLIGEDTHNPPEEVVPAMSEDRYYDIIVWLMIIPQYLIFFGAVWIVGTNALPWWALVALTVGIGTLSGGIITLGHELGHKTDRMNRTMAKIALGLVGYGHFCIEHNRGHHVKVSTPEDCASARMGESVYAFALRELPGALKGAWQHESLRLRNKKLPVFHWQNEILQSWALTVVIAVALVAWLGWAVLPFIIGHHFFAWYGLTQVNYIEHYGLKREKLPNGKYEPCQPHHSWNTNHIVSNILQIHLQRHSDHHANPMRPYQALRNFDDLPRLPSGYPGCLGMAAIPPLWFKVMDPKVMVWAKGDLSKVNMHEPARERLEARYGKAV